MEKDVHPRFACQLETRTWYITDDNGVVETVNGPGVVGMCFRSVSLYLWQDVSCTF